MSKLKWTVSQKVKRTFCTSAAKTKRRYSCKVMVDLMFIQRTKTNSKLVYTFDFISETNRKIVYFFWMDEYLRMSDLKESRDLFCLSLDFNKLFQENEQLGKNVFM